MPIDRGQIEQALVNILKNAIEAIDGDGTITIRLTSRHAPAGRRSSIEDTGPGISRRGPREPVHAVLQHQAKRPGHRPDAGAGDPQPATDSTTRSSGPAKARRGSPS